MSGTKMFSVRLSPPLAAAIILFALAAFLVAPDLDKGIRGGMQKALGLAKVEAEDAIGLDISFESLSPSMLSSLTISNLALRNPRGGTVLEAKRVDVYYNLWSVISRRGPEAISEIRLEGASIDLQLPADRAMLEDLARRLGITEAAALPPILITGRDVGLRVAIEGSGSYEIKADSLSYSTRGAEIAVQAKGRAVADTRGLAGRVEGQVELSGMLAKDFERARFSLSVSASSPDFQLSTQRFELVYAGGVAELLKVRDKAPLDASLRYDLRDGSLTASLRLDNYPLRRSIRLSGALAALRPWLESPYSGNLGFSLPGGDVSRISYDIDLDGTLPPNILPRRYRTSLLAHGDSRSIIVERARLEEGDQAFEYRGSLQFRDLAPDGELEVRFSLLDGRLPISSRFKVLGHGGEFAALSEGLTVGGVGIEDLAVSAAYRRRQVEFGLSFRPPEAEEPGATLPSPRFSGEPGSQLGALPRVFCEGSLNLEGKPSLDVAVDLEELDLNPLRPILEALSPSRELTGFVSQLKLGGALYLATDFEALSWSASDLAVVSRSSPGAYALLSLSGNLESIEVRKATLALGGYTIEGRASLDLAGHGRVGFETSFKLKDIPYQLRGSLVENGIFISGDYGLEVSARSSDGETFVKARARDLPFPVGGGVVLATLDADGRFSSAKDWRLALSVLSVVPAGERLGRLPTVSLSGVIDQDSGDIPQISVGDRTSTLVGSMSFG
ncbi:MAG TPA: hypothetical protein VFL04_00210, partial [Rectinemataceae bacterium]|nr:hypothetical protein [Rectinemataceae bacterium]